MREQTTSFQRHKSGEERTSSRELFYSPGQQSAMLKYASPSRLCGDCDHLKYCQYARNLSHNHAAYVNSQRIINGYTNKKNNSSPEAMVDQHIFADRLKLRHKTCPFHRELTLG